MTERKYREFADAVCALGSVSDPEKEARLLCRRLRIPRADIDEILEREFGLPLVDIIGRISKHA